MKNKLFLSLIALLFGIFSIAQSGFRPGFVIDLANDTIRGEVDLRGGGSMHNECRFRVARGATVITYKPFDIEAYGFDDGRFFISREVNERPVFLEFLVKGYLNLYFLIQDSKERFFMEKELTELIEIKYEELEVFRDMTTQHSHIHSDRFIQRSSFHIGLLQYHTQDAPSLRQTIERISRPNQKDLIEFAVDYHNLVCDDYDCTVFRKILPPVRANLELVGGLFINRSYLHFPEGSVPIFGLVARVTIPRLSEDIALKTGVLFSKYQYRLSIDEYAGTTKTLYLIPFQLEYTYPKGLIKPVLAVGFAIPRGDKRKFFSDDRVASTVFSGGLIAKINEQVGLRFNADIEFAPKYNLPVIPHTLRGYGLSLGLSYHF